MPRATPPTAAPAAAVDLSQSLQVFRPGRHIAMSGDTLAFSEADLAATAQAYSPALHEAPIVIGHPSADGPAYGWVSSVRHVGGALEAQPHQVDAAFAELVKAGRYKKISASFYAPDAPNNPVPGVYYLRHVGFLGAMAPAVKGLRAPSFADGEAGVVEFAEWDDVTNAGLWRRLREWLIGKFDLATADAVVPSWDVASLENAARDELREASTDVATATPVSFSAPQEPTVTPQEAQALQAENARLKAELDAATAAQRKARHTALRAEQTAFCERLVTEGRLSADGAAVWALELGNVATADTPVHFGEGATQRPLLDALREQLAALPVRVEFAELATTQRADPQAGSGSGAGHIDFAAPQGYTVDGGSAALHRRVKAYQASHPGTSYDAALTAVQAGAA
ncbi:MAG: hypothetical protein RLY71_433 [Pseudomonadota bacterium]|jgi:hypothetical protein